MLPASLRGALRPRAPLAVADDSSPSRTPLQVAVVRGAGDVVDLLLACPNNGVNLREEEDAEDEEGKTIEDLTALVLAVRHTRVALLPALVKAGADLELLCEGRTALHHAIASADGASEEDATVAAETVRALLELGANASKLPVANEAPHRSPIMMAVVAGSSEILGALLQHHDVAFNIDLREGHLDGATALILAVRHDKAALILPLVRGGASTELRSEELTAVHWAVKLERVACLRALLSAGASRYNPTTTSPSLSVFELAIAVPAAANRRELLEVLLAHKARPPFSTDSSEMDDARLAALQPVCRALCTCLRYDDRVCEVSMPDASGACVDFSGSALHIAVMQQFGSWNDVLKALVDVRDADDNLLVDGHSPLHCAIKSRPSCVRTLLALGADPNLRCVCDGTELPPHLLAIRYGAQAAAFALLCHSSIDVNARERTGGSSGGSSGGTPLMLAATSEHSWAPDLVERLCYAGADKEALYAGPLAAAVGLTALGLAAAAGRALTLSILAHSGASLNPVRADGSTTLLRAIDRRDEATALLLLDLGADPVAGISGTSPLALAERRGLFQVEARLRQLAAARGPL